MENDVKEHFEQIENDVENLMATLRIVSGDNERLTRNLRRLIEENERLSNLVKDHEKRISELEDSFLI